MKVLQMAILQRTSLPKKIFDVRYWWPVLFNDAREYCRLCDAC